MLVMAKKRKNPTEAAPRETRPMVGIACSPAWKVWLQAAADDAGMPVSVWVSIACKKHAESLGFSEPMPRR